MHALPTALPTGGGPGQVWTRCLAQDSAAYRENDLLGRLVERDAHAVAAISLPGIQGAYLRSRPHRRVSACAGGRATVRSVPICCFWDTARGSERHIIAQRRFARCAMSRPRWGRRIDGARAATMLNAMKKLKRAVAPSSAAPAPRWQIYSLVHVDLCHAVAEPSAGPSAGWGMPPMPQSMLTLTQTWMQFKSTPSPAMVDRC